MIDFIVVNDPEKEKEIWDLNPELRYMEPFATFRKTSKRNASKIMNAIWMIYDPKSKFRAANKSEADVISDVNKNYLGNENYDWEPYQEIVDAYKEQCKTFLQKQLEEWAQDIKERDDFIRSLRYSDPEQAETKDKMLENRDKLYEKYLETEALVKREYTKNLKLKGDYRMSFLESAGKKKNR